MSACVKLAGSRLPVVEIVFVRALISQVLSLVALRHAGIPLLGTHRFLLLARGTFGCVGLFCVFYSVTHLPLAEATVLQYLHPIFVTVLAALLLSERIGLAHVLGLSLAFLGALTVIRPGANMHTLPTFGVLVAISGALLSACAYTIVRKLASSGEHPLVIVLYFPLITVPAATPLLWHVAVWPTPNEWLCLLGVGIFTQIGQVSLTQGMKHEPASRATVLSYLQVPIAAGIAVVAFGEPILLTTVLGAGILFAGAILVVKRRPTTPT